MAIMKVLRILFLVWISCFFISALSAQDMGEYTADELFSFAEHLFKQEDYYRAAGEYERFIFNFPDDERADIAGFKIGLCHQKLGKFEKAILEFNKLMKRKKPVRNLIFNRSGFEICRSCYLSEDYNRALAEIDKLSKSSLPEEVSSQILYLQGWCYLKQRQWGRAGDAFKGVSGQFPATGLASVSDVLGSYSAGAKRLPKKSPLLAGFFSIIPGAGQVYLGRSKDGIYSFALTGGAAALSNHYYRRDEKSISYLLAGLSALFYAGNVYGAVSSAELINVSRELNYLYEIEERAKDESWPVPDTLFLGIRILYN